MDLQLEGKRALVSGSTAGIGYAIAEALASEGASVLVNGQTDERVKAAVAKIAKSGARGKVEGVAAAWEARRARALFSSATQRSTFW